MERMDDVRIDDVMRCHRIYSSYLNAMVYRH
jgi:hypothetical protein